MSSHSSPYFSPVRPPSQLPRLTKPESVSHSITPTKHLLKYSITSSNLHNSTGTSPQTPPESTSMKLFTSSDPVNHGPNYAFYGFFASRWGVHGELGYESVFKLENRRLVHEGLVVDYSPLRLWPPMTALTYAPDSHADFEFQAVQHNVGGKTVYYLEFLGPGRSPFFLFLLFLIPHIPQRRI